MTRARALKQVIRARAAKTGERYTTARRHVLKDLQQGTALPARPRSTTAPQAAAAGTSKGGVSDAKSLEKTGHGLDHWFDVLDRFGAVEKGHSAAARHLYEAHHVGGWYAQGITVAYERARGVRAINQRCDGEYEVSVSKVVAADTTEVIKAFTEARQRRRWVEGVDARLVQRARGRTRQPGVQGIRGQGGWPGTLSIQMGRHHGAAIPDAKTGRQGISRRGEHQAGRNRDGGRAPRAMANCAESRGRAPDSVTGHADDSSTAAVSTDEWSRSRP